MNMYMDYNLDIIGLCVLGIDKLVNKERGSLLQEIINTRDLFEKQKNCYLAVLGLSDSKGSLTPGFRHPSVVLRKNGGLTNENLTDIINAQSISKKLDKETYPDNHYARCVILQCYQRGMVVLDLNKVLDDEDMKVVEELGSSLVVGSNANEEYRNKVTKIFGPDRVTFFPNKKLPSVKKMLYSVIESWARNPVRKENLPRKYDGVVTFKLEDFHSHDGTSCNHNHSHQQNSIHSHTQEESPCNHNHSHQQNNSRSHAQEGASCNHNHSHQQNNSHSHALEGASCNHDHGYSGEKNHAHGHSHGGVFCEHSHQKNSAHQLEQQQKYEPLVAGDTEWRTGRTEEAVLFEIARSVNIILNNLAPDNFETSSDQIINIGIDDEKIMEVVVDRIFDKALIDPEHCHIYAQLCFKITEELPKVQKWTEDSFSHSPFRKYLLNKCQDEVEKITAWRDEEKSIKANEAKMAELTEQEKDVYFIAKKNMEIAEVRAFGTVAFIGELFKLKMLTEKCVHVAVKNLLRDIIDPAEIEVEAVCKLLISAGAAMEENRSAKNHLDAYFSHMKELSENKELPSHLRYMLLEVIEMRENNWKPRINYQSDSPHSHDNITCSHNHREHTDSQGDQPTSHCSPELDSDLEYGKEIQNTMAEISQTPQSATRHLIQGKHPQYIQAIANLCTFSTQTSDCEKFTDLIDAHACLKSAVEHIDKMKEGDSFLQPRLYVALLSFIFHVIQKREYLRDQFAVKLKGVDILRAASNGVAGTGGGVRSPHPEIREIANKIVEFLSAVGIYLRKCAVCENREENINEFKTCSRCRFVAYCSKECQVKDWEQKDHKQFCAEL